MSERGLTAEKTKTDRDGMESCAGNGPRVSPLLSGEDTKQYRSLTMRAAYLAMDRADLGSEAGMQLLKRPGRYLNGKPRVAQRFEAPSSRVSNVGRSWSIATMLEI